ncbi:aryl-alcohol-oxidase from pleurotus Eryingii [Lactarius akahatsu]|uniref:Aryl-alcohol-oxidase from pleurotus Eryingii n=1 Tax=Lactarius akahatsu TaxID=416441 RepID=A0AAD4QBL8_9AGAM|nr:aryl-alcohol-oxidase from pleurotus Eryingii [Lactarius akahatsu]
MRLPLISLLFLKSVFAAVYTDPSLLPNSPYTYIIVGSGPGGSVLANRLSANPNNRVLLIEVGPSDTVNPNIRVPFLCTTLVPADVSYNETTVPQTGFGGRSIGYPRGRTLGGSSSVNYMVWTRGPASDFNRLAHETGDHGWSWKSLRRILTGVETLVPPPDGHDTTGEIDPSIHGSNGPVKISLHDKTALDSRIFKATSQLAEFPFNKDMNSGNPLGFGWTQFSIGDGQRSSATASYLTPVLCRPNLDVLVNTLATKVVQTGTQDGLPIFRGVEIAQSCLWHALLSYCYEGGIGDSAELSRFNIRTIVDLPDVGKNMQDHVLLLNPFWVNSSSTGDDIGRDSRRSKDGLAQWEASHTGPFAASVGGNIGWLRLPKHSPIFKQVRDPSSGPHAPHIELLTVNQFFSAVQPPPATGHFMSIGTILLTPTSRGSITLASANPFDSPNIDPALLNSDFDIFTMREAVKAALRFVAAPAFKDYVIGPFGDLAEAKTDADIEAYVRSQSSNVFHPACTAYMSRKGSAHGVVDPDFSVKKTIGLRIVDGSVLPHVPAAHPQAIIFIIAERAAELILASEDSHCS